MSKEDFYVDKDECNRADTTPGGPAGAAAGVRQDQRAGDGDGRQFLPALRRRLRHAPDVHGPREGPRRDPQLIFRGFAVAGCDPDEMGIGPVFAVPKLLQRHGLKVSDIDVWELNEAFAVQVLYCRDRLGIDPAKLNVNGGSVSIGHPFGMTGSRMVGTLANEMLRRKAKYGW